jgi:hypothetical protein
MRPSAVRSRSWGVSVVRVVLGGAALLTFAAGSTIAAEGVAAYEPRQAIFFDGDPTAASTYFIAFSNQGVLRDLGKGGSPCSGVLHVSPGGVVPAVPNAGVFQSAPGFDASPLPTFPASFAEPPVDIKEINDDCGLLASFSLVQSYLASVASAVQDRVDEIQACVNQVRAGYCRIVHAVEEATAKNPASTIVPIAQPLSPVNGLGLIFAPDFESCTLNTFFLYEIPGFLDYLSSSLGDCQKVGDMLQELDDIVTTMVTLGGGIPSNIKVDALSYADDLLALAEEVAGQAALAAQQFTDVVAEITQENLQASCAHCLHPAQGRIVIQASGAVLVQEQREPIGRLVGAFNAAGLSDLGKRLARVPNHRVLHYTFPSPSAVGQDLVAMRAADAFDDGVAPLVVILSALPQDAPLPEMNVADLRVLYEGFRAFAEVLGQRRR